MTLRERVPQWRPSHAWPWTHVSLAAGVAASAWALQAWLPILGVLLLGAVLGCAATVAGTVALFLAFTHVGSLNGPEASPGRQDPAPEARAMPPPPDPGACQGRPPHTTPVRGWFAGPVYLAPLSTWRRDATVVKWPPSPVTEPSLAPWDAVLDQGTLVLTRGGVDGVPPTKVGIPLEGCSVELVRDGLNGRSEYIRRGPLLITHAEWPLFAGEQAFFLFACDPASKQGWLHALQWWCEGCERLRSIEVQYQRYCEAMSRQALLPFALACDAAGPPDPPPPGSARVGSQWRRLGAATAAAFRGRRGRERAAGSIPAAGAVGAPAPNGAPPDLATGPAAAGAPVPAARAPLASAPSSASTTGEEDSIERFWDRKWMQSSRVPLPPATARRAAAAAAGQSVASMPVEICMQPCPAAGGPSPGESSPDGGDPPFLTPASSPAKPVRGAGGVEPGPGAGSPEAAWGGPAPAAAPPGPGPTPPLPLDHALNLLLVRAGFDALRGGAAREALFRRIQRQLSRLQTADVVQELRLLEVDPGSSVPTVSRAASLPCPHPGALWPQLAFDVRYAGAFAVVLEAKLELRDAAAWGRLDATLARWEAGPGGAGGLSVGPGLGGAAGPGSAGPCPPGDEPPSPRPPRARLGGLRRSAARTLRGLAESAADGIGRVPLRLRLTFSELEGRMVAWIPPAPGNRLFYSFLAPPRLVVTAAPQLGSRLLKYSAHVARVSSLIEQRVRMAFTRNIVFPGGGDILLPGLLGLEDPGVDACLPGLGPPGAGRGDAARGEEGTGPPGAGPEEGGGAEGGAGADDVPVPGDRRDAEEGPPAPGAGGARGERLLGRLAQKRAQVVERLRRDSGAA
ncbi:hypothetical protein ACKKBF_B15705 [Auxenochlorella protothecoides x Auxenochlorella symbiontica]